MQKRQSRQRSDKVRRRLKEESKDWIDQASRRIIDPSPTYFPNRGRLDADNPKQVQHATRENHFFRIGWRLLSFILVGVFSFAIFTAWRSPQYKVSEVLISGLQRLPVDAVQQSLELDGEHIFSLESEKIKETLRTDFPELRDIQITFSLPAKVLVSVVERQPVIAWEYGNSQIWIDSAGYLIPARGEGGKMLTIKADAFPSYHLAFEDNSDYEKNIILDKPTIKNPGGSFLFFAFPKQIDGNLLTAILQLNAWMPEESSLLYQEKRGIGWRDSRNWNVFVGSKLENINDKMLMYETIVRKVENQGIKPSMVSVEFLHAPYYRLEK